MADSDYQVTDLVEKAKAGNRAALEQLVDYFHKDVFRMVYYRTHSRMDAEDLTQEIFMKMSKSLSSLKDASRLRPWLFRIALNRVRDFHRKKSILSFFGTTTELDVAAQATAEDYNNPVNNMILKEFQLQFHQFTQGLSRWEREVFMLRFVDHLGIREIAEALKKSESTIKTQLYRALKKFRQNPGLHDLLKGRVS
jgi:RNA polymerase sigma-70 factor (ECF subfamily)